MPGPRYHWPALELGGARAPATALGWRSAGRGSGLGAEAIEHAFPTSFRGVFPRVGARGGDGLRLSSSYMPGT